MSESAHSPVAHEGLASSSGRPIPPKVAPWRRWLGPLIIVGGMLAHALLLLRFAENRTFTIASFLFVWPATLFLFSIWWLFLSGFTWKTRLTAAGLAAAVLLTLAAVYRIDSLNGDMVPVVSYRWGPRAEDLARNYRESQKQAVSNAANATPAVTNDEFPAATPLDWPQYRGWDRLGNSPLKLANHDWQASPPESVWRHPVGPGWSSFAIVGNRAFTQEQRDQKEAVVCYDTLTGQEIWSHEDEARFSEVMGGDGPRATPSVSEGLVYSLGATGVLNCLDARSGIHQWSRQILKDSGSTTADTANIQWGMSASPLVANGLVYTIPGSTSGKSVIAYDAKTGEIRWSTSNYIASYAAPQLLSLAGTPMLLVFHGLGLAAFSPESGELLWEFGPWTNNPKVNSAMPIQVSESDIVISSGYEVGSARLNISKGADGQGWAVTKVWQVPRFELKFNDGVFHEGHIYGLDDGILACQDVATGKLTWKKGRYGYGQLIKLDEHLLVLTESGELALVAADPKKFTEISRVRVLSEATTWNHPALAGNLLLVRHGGEAAAFRLPIADLK